MKPNATSIAFALVIALAFNFVEADAVADASSAITAAQNPARRWVVGPITVGWQAHCIFKRNETYNEQLTTPAGCPATFRNYLFS